MPLTKEQQEIVDGAARRYLDSFCLAVDDKYRVNWHHEIIARALERALENAIANRKTRIIIEVPPRHGKSEEASIKFPAWALGKYPDIPIIVCSYSADLAVSFGLKTRDTVLEPNYQSIFPGTRLRPDQTAKGRWLTDKKGSYTAAGIGGGITGRGFKVGIVDDPFKNRQEANSITIREKVWDWWKSTFYTRQEGYGAIILIMTRWHKDDLVGRVLQKEAEDRAAGEKEFDEWEIIRFPAIAEEEEEFRHTGEALWPEKMTLPMLQNTRNTLGLYDWSALYQQTPITSELQEFKEEWFKEYEPQTLLTIPQLKYYTLIDLGHKDRKEKKDKKEPDRTVVRTIAKPKHLPHWYLIEETAGVFDPGQTLDAMFFHQKTYQSEVWVEGVGYQRALEYFARERMKKDQQIFVINLLKRNNSVAKSERIRGLIPMAKNHFILVRKNGDDKPLIREALDFPQGMFDDRLDCLANGLEAILGTATVKKSSGKTAHIPLSSEFGG
jgi:hypothetical protein